MQQLLILWLTIFFTQLKCNLNFHQVSEINEFNSIKESSVIQVLLILIGIIGGMVAALMLLKLFIHIRHRQLIHQYAIEPESLMAKQITNMTQKLELRRWEWNQFEEGCGKTKNVITQRKLLDNEVGEIFEIKFEQQNVVRAIKSNRFIGESDKENQQYYFEVEIESYKNKCPEICIGLSSKDNFSNDTFPGEYPTSLGIRSVRGVVTQERNVKFEFGFICQYGETIGLGYDMKNKRVYCTFNGKLYNQPPSTELKDYQKKIFEEQNKSFFSYIFPCCYNDNTEDKTTDNDKTKKEEEQQKKGKRFEMQKQFDEQMAKWIILFNSDKDLYPIIATNGPCTLKVNIGGAPFRYYQKEIKYGFL